MASPPYVERLFNQHISQTLRYNYNALCQNLLCQQQIKGRVCYTDKPKDNTSGYTSIINIILMSEMEVISLSTSKIIIITFILLFNNYYNYCC